MEGKVIGFLSWLIFAVFNLHYTTSEELCYRDTASGNNDCNEVLLNHESLFKDSEDRVLEWEHFDNASSQLDGGLCNIDRVPYISNREFLMTYAFEKPVIFVGVSDNSKFRDMSTRKALLERYANNTIKLSTANTHSYDKFQVPLKEYLENYLRPQSLDVLGKNTKYFFGDNNHTEWKELFDEYIQPPYSLPDTTGAYSFGVAGSGTGVPFHFHGPGFSEVIHGSKRWFLYPYENRPKFDPDESMLQWVTEQYPKLHSHQKPYECTIKPGEVLYFPNWWWHATLNLKTSVFMSTFLS